MGLLSDFRLSVIEKNLGVHGIHVYQIPHQKMMLKPEVVMVIRFGNAHHRTLIEQMVCMVNCV